MLDSVSDSDAAVLELTVITVLVSELLARLAVVRIGELITGAESVAAVKPKKLVAVEDVVISEVSGSSDVIEGIKMLGELVSITLAVESTMVDGFGVTLGVSKFG
jgi:hypothetical protein